MTSRIPGLGYNPIHDAIHTLVTGGSFKKYAEKQRKEALAKKKSKKKNSSNEDIVFNRWGPRFVDHDGKPTGPYLKRSFVEKREQDIKDMEKGQNLSDEAWVRLGMGPTCIDSKYVSNNQWELSGSMSSKANQRARSISSSSSNLVGRQVSAHSGTRFDSRHTLSIEENTAPSVDSFTSRSNQSRQILQPMKIESAIPALNIVPRRDTKRGEGEDFRSSHSSVGLSDFVSQPSRSNYQSKDNEYPLSQSSGRTKNSRPLSRRHISNASIAENLSGSRSEKKPKHARPESLSKALGKLSVTESEASDSLYSAGTPTEFAAIGDNSRTYIEGMVEDDDYKKMVCAHTVLPSVSASKKQ